MTDAAERDLDSIWDTIVAEGSTDVADNFIWALQKHFEPLRKFPNAGAPRDHLLPGLRVVFHRRYAIYYKPLPKIVFIVRVVHSARDITTMFEGGEE
nr:type II toxin-antitoxin system RelE/ParE family toxin [Rhizomicrobium electricum]